MDNEKNPQESLREAESIDQAWQRLLEAFRQPAYFVRIVCGNRRLHLLRVASVYRHLSLPVCCHRKDRL